VNARTVRSLSYAAAVVVLIALLLLWQWYAVTNRIFFLPAPSAIGEALWKQWLPSAADGSRWLTGLAAIGQTFASAMAGWGIAGVVGIVAGAILGRWRTLADLADIPLLLVRSVPAVAVIPICIVIFGLGLEMKLIVVSFGCIWPVLLNTVQGVGAINPVQLDVARLSRLGLVARFVRVMVPAASPKIFAGLRVSMSMAIVVTVGAEMFAGAGGLGGMVLNASATYDLPGLWAGLLIVALCGLAANYLFLLVERASLHWHTRRRTQ